MSAKIIECEAAFLAYAQGLPRTPEHKATHDRARLVSAAIHYRYLPRSDPKRAARYRADFALAKAADLNQGRALLWAEVPYNAKT